MTSQNKTPSFRDAEGREWHLSLSIGLARRIKDEVGVDFGQLADGKLLAELGTDPEKLCSALWLMCEKQAERQSVTPEGFAESLDGDAIDGAMEALVEAIVLFTRSHLRNAMRTMFSKTKVAQEKTAKAAETWIETNADQITNQVIEEAMGKLAASGRTSPS